MWKKGDLLLYGKYRAIFLGAERLLEDIDEHGLGGLFRPQVKIVICSMPDNSESWWLNVGDQKWVDRKLVKKLYLG